MLVSVTAVNYVSLLAQTSYYCGLSKVAIELSQVAGGTKHTFRITCLLCTDGSTKKPCHSTSVEELPWCPEGTLNCPLSFFLTSWMLLLLKKMFFAPFTGKVSLEQDFNNGNVWNGSYSVHKALLFLQL